VKAGKANKSPTKEFVAADWGYEEEEKAGGASTFQ
jgi:hypothetical protein